MAEPLTHGALASENSRKLRPLINSSTLKRSVAVADHKTSVSLEEEFWSALKEIASFSRNEPIRSSHLNSF